MLKQGLEESVEPTHSLERGFVKDWPTSRRRRVSPFSRGVIFTRARVSLALLSQPRPQGFSLKKWVGWEMALASAGHVSPRTP